MAKGLTIEVQGLSNVLDNLNKHKNTKVNAISAEVKSTAYEIEADAKKSAPVDLGHLRQSTRVTKVTKFDAEIEAQAEYSAYVEFGTGASVDVPAGLESYAMQFKKDTQMKDAQLELRRAYYQQLNSLSVNNASIPCYDSIAPDKWSVYAD